MVVEKVQKVSLKRLYYAKMTDEETETFDEVKTLTMPIELTLSPNYAEGTFDAGDQVVATETQLDTISLSGQVADLPTETQADWFGHELSTEKGLIENVNDDSNYVAIGFESGSKLVWLYKTKLRPTEDTNATKRKGEITYKQSGISGEAIPLNSGTLKYTIRLDDEGVTATPETFFATVTLPNTIVI